MVRLRESRGQGNSGKAERAGETVVRLREGRGNSGKAERGQGNSGSTERAVEQW